MAAVGQKEKKKRQKVNNWFKQHSKQTLNEK